MSNKIVTTKNGGIRALDITPEIDDEGNLFVGATEDTASAKDITCHTLNYEELNPPITPSTQIRTGNISFWTNMGGQDVRGGLIPKINVDCTQFGETKGFPVLPHGGGAQYNVFGNYIKIPTDNAGATFGEYMPFDGKIIAIGINWWRKAFQEFKVYAVNYGPSNFITTPELVITIPLQFESVGSDSGLSIDNPINFQKGDYIGIYLTCEENICNIAIEGTIYFEYNY